MPLVICRHPIAEYYLTVLRDKETPPAHFRQYCDRITTVLTVEVTRDLRVRNGVVNTPLEPAEGIWIDERLVVVPILRAGLGMLNPVVDLIPTVEVGYAGLERDESTAIASVYYRKFPDVKGKRVLLLDPMLATGGSASQTMTMLKEAGAGRIQMVCIVSAPEGVERIANDHPDVDVYTVSVDRTLNDQKYILPGLGDFGDRLYGT
jgi:uracil phosphoribosyltransferase